MKESEIRKRVAESQLQNYFLKVRELMKSGTKFCVSFDVVYPLAYTRKDSAVKELRKKFVHGKDYVMSSVPVDTSNGGVSRRVDITLTSECLEHFIASKVPAVFEVYRKVFHEVADLQEEMLAVLPNFKDPAEAARAWAHQYDLKQMAQDKVLKLKPLADYAENVLSSTGAYTMSTMAKYFGYKSGFILAQKLNDAKVLLKSKSPYKLSAKYMGQKHPEYVKYGTHVVQFGGRKYSRATLTWTEEGKRLIASLKAKGKI